MKIPYFKQANLSECSIACIRMILSGKEKEIKNSLGFKSEKGIDLAKIQEFFNKQGFKTVYSFNSKNFDKAIRKLKQHLENDFAIIALVNRFAYDKKTPRVKKKVFWENKDFSLHYIVITGSDDDFIYFNDPHEIIGKSKLKITEFGKAWSYKLPWKYVFLAVKKQIPADFSAQTFSFFPHVIEL